MHDRCWTAGSRNTCNHRTPEAASPATPTSATPSTCRPGALPRFTKLDVEVLTFDIFHLPLELRLAVYDSVLVGSRNSLCLLQACRQVNMEAGHLAYKRSTSFASQAKFFAWIERSRVQSLNHVRTVTLRLTDVDLTPLLTLSTERRQPGNDAWSLYQSDLQRLEQSLSALPNLTSLTIVPPKIGQSQLLRNMYHSFLAEVPRRCPKLKHLEIYDGSELLDAVPALKEVRGITFSDLASKATEAAGEDRRDPDAAASVASPSRDKGKLTMSHFGRTRVFSVGENIT